MASKIITLRLPRTTYELLAKAAAVAGLPLSVYVRGRIDSAELSANIELLRSAVLNAVSESAPRPGGQTGPELLLLARAIAAHLNPRIPQEVAARLRASTGANR